MTTAIRTSNEFEFEALLHSVLQERSAWSEPPAGLEQRLTARLAQEPEARPIAAFVFAQGPRTQRSSASLWFAAAAHGLALLLILAVASRHLSVPAPTKTLLTTALIPPPAIPPAAHTIGGGGGHHDIAPDTAGHLPKFAQHQILPPKAPPTEAPRLAIEPTFVMQKDLKLAQNTLPNLGLPNSPNQDFSLGNGNGTGLGAGDGSGLGPGSGGNIGRGVYAVGGAVSQPQVLVSADPEFSEEARKAKFSGNVLVYFIVDEHGTPTHVRVARGVGMGLDEKAVDAIRQYKFKPGLKDGKPVKVQMAIEVNFQIL
jgi:protein TonB